MLHEDRSRATSFGSDAERYDRSRPGYPDELVDDLMTDGPETVLDVGCGTGIAGGRWLDRGCRVLGVEVDDRMAALARRRGLDVEVSGFEQWDRQGRVFDLVISGQAWHWVDPLRGAHVAAEALRPPAPGRPGGRIALFWNRPDHPVSVRSAFQAVYRAEAPSLEHDSIVLGYGTGNRFGVAVEGLQGSGRFEASHRRRYRREVVYSTEGWIEQLATHSDHRALPPSTRERLLAGIGAVVDGWGGSFTTIYETVLVTARRS